MEHQIIKLMKYATVVVLLIFVMQSCYYDNVEELYPIPSACDTTNITYSENVWPVINDNCTVCHSGSAPSGNISLTNYEEVAAIAANGKLMGAINHENGYSPMPKGGGSLSDCELTQFQIWVDEGYPNN